MAQQIWYLVGNLFEVVEDAKLPNSSPGSIIFPCTQCSNEMTNAFDGLPAHLWLVGSRHQVISKAAANECLMPVRKASNASATVLPVDVRRRPLGIPEAAPHSTARATAVSPLQR